MSLFLGIDGGGTKTKVILINKYDEIIFENTDGPSSVDTVSNEVSFKHILKAVSPYFLNNSDTISGIFCGVGGIVFDHQKNSLKELLKKLPGVTKETKIIVENDMYNALYSGKLFNEGIALICGTGMVAFGKNILGATHKAGGWGYKEGEWGSGFALGKAAISHCIRCFDHRYPMDDFALDVAKEIGLNQASDIIAILDNLYTNRTSVASLAPFVTKHASLENKHALKIIETSTDELFLAVNAVTKELSLVKPKLVIVGSLGNIDGPFKKSLHKKLLQIEHLEILKPLVDPALASALYIKKSLLD